jgi:hypothetical protein
MGIARLSATGLAVAALVIGVAATGCSKNDKESSAEETTSSSTTTSAEATTSEETSAAAEPVDYGSLLIPASDMGPDTKTTGPQVNPNGVEGAAQAYESPDGKSQIIDTIMVFSDVATAEEAFKNMTYDSVTTGKPEPAEIGDQGVLAIGTTPDGSRSMTVAVFNQGRTLVEIRFEGELNDPVPPDIATAIAQKQAQLIADGLPEE